jgi:GNAT superfamily N-acetyltransferase
MARHHGYTTSGVTLPILTGLLQAKNADSADYEHIGDVDDTAKILRFEDHSFLGTSLSYIELHMNELQLRFAADDDAEAIAGLVNASFKVERFFIDGDRINPGRVRDMLRTGKFLLREEGGALIACVYVEIREERGYFGLLAVDPVRQGKGLGQKMVEVAEDYARVAGCAFMDLLIVNLRAELPPFYRRLGYVETGTEPFPADANPRQPCHFVKMSKPLGMARAADNS